MTKHDAGSARGRRIAELEREYAELQLLCEEMLKEGLMTLTALTEGRDEAYRKIRDRIKSIRVALQLLEEMPKAGRPPERANYYRALKEECLKLCRGDMPRAERLFLERAIGDDVHPKTARNEWLKLKAPKRK
jgi:predicted nuclease with TOPRIM domain